MTSTRQLKARFLNSTPFLCVPVVGVVYTDRLTAPGIQYSFLPPAGVSPPACHYHSKAGALPRWGACLAFRGMTIAQTPPVMIDDHHPRMKPVRSESKQMRSARGTFDAAGSAQLHLNALILGAWRPNLQCCAIYITQTPWYSS